MARECPLTDEAPVLVDIGASTSYFLAALFSDGRTVTFGGGYPAYPLSPRERYGCLTSLDVDGNRGGLSYENSITIIVWNQGKWPVTLDLPDGRKAVEFESGRDVAVRDDRGDLWVAFDDPEKAGAGKRGFVRVPLPEPIVDVTSYQGVCGRSASGSVYCQDWFNGDVARFGMGFDVDLSRMVQLPIEGCLDFTIGGSNTYYLDEEGTAWVAGSAYGLGNPGGRNVDTAEYIPIAGVPPLVRVWSGRYRGACGLSVDDELWCWGINNYGELGEELGGIFPTPLGRFPGLLDIGMADSNTCILRADRTMVCRGIFVEELSCGVVEDGWHVVDFNGCDVEGVGP